MWFHLHQIKIFCDKILLFKCNFWYYKIFNMKRKSMELSRLALCAQFLPGLQGISDATLN